MRQERPFEPTEIDLQKIIAGVDRAVSCVSCSALSDRLTPVDDRKSIALEATLDAYTKTDSRPYGDLEHWSFRVGLRALKSDLKRTAKRWGCLIVNHEHLVPCEQERCDDTTQLIETDELICQQQRLETALRDLDSRQRIAVLRCASGPRSWAQDLAREWNLGAARVRQIQREGFQKLSAITGQDV